jgi:hypothetical protein
MVVEYIRYTVSPDCAAIEEMKHYEKLAVSS